MTTASLPVEASLHPHRPADQGRLIASFPAPEGIAFEEAHFQQFRTGSDMASELHFWTQSRCLVTTPAFARRREFKRASAHSPWPVAVRRSGGATIFHEPGVLCVTLFEQLVSANIERAYSGICSLIVNGLRELGVQAEVGPLPSAPCDGRFNILLDGRKLAGTAARISPAGNRVVVMAHAALLVEGDCRAGVEAVAAFENALGLDAAYPSGCMTTLAEHVDRIDVVSVAAAIRKIYRQL